MRDLFASRIPANAEVMRVRLRPPDPRRGLVLSTYSSKVYNTVIRRPPNDTGDRGWTEFDVNSARDREIVLHLMSVTQLGRTREECHGAGLRGGLAEIPAFDVAFSRSEQYEIEKSYRVGRDSAPQFGTIENPLGAERLTPGRRREHTSVAPRAGSVACVLVDGPDGPRYVPVESAALLPPPPRRPPAPVEAAPSTDGERPGVRESLSDDASGSDDELAGMTKSELRELAESRGLDVPANARKDAILELLTAD